LQHHAVEDAEDGNRAADAEGESEYGDYSEARRLQQHTHGIANILNDTLEKISTCLSRHNRISIKSPFDVLKVSGEEIFTFEFVESGAECGVFRLAAGEKFLVAIFEVLRKLISDLGFARRSEV
jgi:hypothetical protein